jgi:hypothetical protein
MKRFVATSLFVLFVGITTTAQQPQNPPRFHQGTRKIWTGALLVGAGALIVPFTATKPERSPTGAVVVAGVGTAALGTAMIWWGVQDHRKASRPHTGFAIILGRTQGVQIRRTW